MNAGAQEWVIERVKKMAGGLRRAGPSRRDTVDCHQQRHHAATTSTRAGARQPQRRTNQGPDADRERIVASPADWLRIAPGPSDAMLCTSRIWAPASVQALGEIGSVARAERERGELHRRRRLARRARHLRLDAHAAARFSHASALIAFVPLD